MGTVVNTTHIFLTGSNPFYKSYLVDVDSWDFRELPNMHHWRTAPACGLVKTQVTIRLRFKLIEMIS